MTVLFWVASAAMLVVAMGFVLWPMLRAGGVDPDAQRRDALLQAHRAGVLDEAEYRAKLAAFSNVTAARAPTPKLAIGIVALLLPFLAIVGYRVLGDPAALNPQLTDTAAAMNAALASQNETGAAPADAPDMNSAVSGLAERLRNEPDNLDGWMLLGRAYKSMERFEESRAALANAYRLAPDNADVVIEYAESMVLASQTRRFEGESLALLEKALKQQPDSQRGLWLLGVAAYQREDFKSAADTWERLLASMPADAEARNSLITQVTEARSRAGLPALVLTPTPAMPTQPVRDQPATASTAPPAPDSAPAANGTKAKLTVTVDIAPELKAKLGASDVLFVFARAAQGPRMPLAIQRLPAASLPITVTLDDSTSMMPSMTLSSMPQVVVGARISKSGQAIAQPGDFETLSDPIANTRTEPLTLTIDRVVP